MVLCLVGWSKCFWATPLRIKVDCNADFPKSSKSGFVDSKHAQIHRTHQQTTRELAAYLSLRLAKTELQNIILKARYIGRRELRSAPVCSGLAGRAHVGPQFDLYRDNEKPGTLNNRSLGTLSVPSPDTALQLAYFVQFCPETREICSVAGCGWGHGHFNGKEYLLIRH